jgi:hypothetical protein
MEVRVPVILEALMMLVNVSPRVGEKLLIGTTTILPTKVAVFVTWIESRLESDCISISTTALADWTYVLMVKLAIPLVPPGLSMPL